MKIFVCGLPTNTSSSSLRAFAETILRPPWYQPLRKRIQIKSCIVLKMKDLDSSVIEFHGLLEVMPYQLALAAIESLNHREFQGRRLEVRGWRERTALNDRRNTFGQATPEDERERRRRERRRHLLIETYEPPRFEGMRQFHRQFD